MLACAGGKAVRTVVDGSKAPLPEHREHLKRRLLAAEFPLNVGDRVIHRLPKVADARTLPCRALP